MGYIHYTEKEREQARKMSIADIIRKNGGTLKRSGSEEEWVDGGDKITVNGNVWFNHYEQKGGDTISFVQKFMGLDYSETMKYLLGNTAGELRIAPKVEKKPSGPMKLPEKNNNMRRVNWYLTKERGLDYEVVKEFAKYGLIYQSTDYANVVFVGCDKNRKPKHAHMRGTNSKFKGNQENGIPEFSFHWVGKSDTLYLFEAPIDMLSFISMNKDGWKQHSYAACCGVSDRVMWQMLKDYPNLKNVKLCLDSDEKGQLAVKRISNGLTIKGIEHEILVPSRKDWNELLLYGEKEIEEQEGEICQALQQ